MFNNIIGLYALFAIVPFILIYLIRPKSFERVIPSLMFIMQERNKFIVYYPVIDYFVFSGLCCLSLLGDPT